jgi:hypothetical protein
VTEVTEKLTKQIAELEWDVAIVEDQILDSMAGGQDASKLVAKQEAARIELARLKLARERTEAAADREAVKSRLEAMKAAIKELDGIEKAGLAAVKEIAGLLSTALVKMAALASVELPTIDSLGHATMPTEILCFAMRQELRTINQDVPIRDVKLAAETEGRLKQAGEEDVQRVISSLRNAAQAWIKESEKILAERKVS